MKKPVSKDKLKRKLYLKCEKLWKEIAFLRDGEECQVRKNYPDVNINHTDILQVDHCFSRADKNLFFDPGNSTVVCSACNMAKGFKNKSVDRCIDIIVREREGEDYFNYMLKTNQSGAPNAGWNKIYWLEEMVSMLENYKKDIE